MSNVSEYIVSFLQSISPIPEILIWLMNVLSSYYVIIPIVIALIIYRKVLI